MLLYFLYVNTRIAFQQIIVLAQRDKRRYLLVLWYFLSIPNFMGLFFTLGVRPSTVRNTLVLPITTIILGFIIALTPLVLRRILNTVLIAYRRIAAYNIVSVLCTFVIITFGLSVTRLIALVYLRLLCVHPVLKGRNFKNNKHLFNFTRYLFKILTYGISTGLVV